MGPGLGTSARVDVTASPEASLVAIVVVFVAAAVLVVPSMVLLYLLQQRGRLQSE